MASFIYNSVANNQFRFISSLRRDDYQIPNDPARRQQVYATGARCAGRLLLGDTFQPSLLLTVSPFYHFNLANYEGDPNILL